MKSAVTKYGLGSFIKKAFTSLKCNSHFRTVLTDSTPFQNPHLECGFGDLGNLELWSLEILSYL